MLTKARPDATKLREHLELYLLISYEEESTEAITMIMKRWMKLKKMVVAFNYQNGLWLNFCSNMIVVAVDKPWIVIIWWQLRIHRENIRLSKETILGYDHQSQTCKPKVAFYIAEKLGEVIYSHEIRFAAIVLWWRDRKTFINLMT